MKYLQLTLQGSTTPYYLNPSKVTSVSAQRTGTTIRLDDGTDIMVKDPAETVVAVLNAVSVDETATAISHLHKSLSLLPSSFSHERLLYSERHQGWLPAFLRKLGVL